MTTVSRDELLRNAAARGVCNHAHPGFDGVRCTEMYGHDGPHGSRAHREFWDQSEKDALTAPYNGRPPEDEGEGGDSEQAPVGHSDSPPPPTSPPPPNLLDRPLTPPPGMAPNIILYDQDKANAQAKRTFESGATRDTDEGKLAWLGATDPRADESFVQYMHDNRRMADGTLRDMSNWMRGIPLDAYIESFLRHAHDFVMLHYGYDVPDTDLIKTLNALRFNSEGYKREIIQQIGEG